MTSTPEQPPKPTEQPHHQAVPFFLEALSQEVGIEMIQIPAGTFMMGSPTGELEREEYEGPQHEVSVAPFFMGKYPVTQAQWRFVAGLPLANRELDPEPSHFKGDQHPVELVSWRNAVEFCDRLSQHTGRAYRLPSEAEWEYACRAGTTTPFHFGETITTDLANYRGTDDNASKWSGSYGRGPKGEYRQKGTLVDQFGIANAFGLYDMHGNVWEWCEDHWHRSYKNAPTDGSAWVEPGASVYALRVMRGGCWKDNPWSCRSSSRHFAGKGALSFNLGFRVVCVAPRTL